ncbi:MAG: beta-propeller fold lactonase family protein [Methylophilaceae bacterium]
MKSTDFKLRLGASLLLVATGLLSAFNATAESKGVAYVSNQNGGVSVIDLETLDIAGNLDPQAKSPRGLGITADGKLLITANKDDGNISIINTATGKLVRHIAIGKNPEFVRIHGDKAFVSFEPSSKGGPPPKPGEMVKADNNKENGNEPNELARIAIVDLKLGKKVREIVGGPETEGIEFSPDGKKLIITNEADNTVTVHNISTGKLLKTIPTKAFGDRPRGIKISPDGKFYVTTLEFGNKFLVLDSEFKPVRTVDTGKAPYGISFDPEGKRIYVASSKEKALQVFDAKSFAKIKDIPTGDRCWHFSFTPDGKQILLACGKSDEVQVIDVEKLETIKRISDKETPWGVITYPKSFGSLDKP